MKAFRTLSYMAAMTALCSLAACSSDNDNALDNGPVAAKVTASIDGPLTRAAGTAWDGGDRIGISCTSTGNTKFSNILYTISNTSTGSFTSTTPIYFQDTEEVTFSAYYPHAATLTDGKISKTIANTDQESATQKEIDYMFATGAKASKANPEVKFIDANGTDARFKHCMSKLTLVFKQGHDTDLKNMTDFTVKGLKMEGEFNATTGIAKATADAASDLKITDTPTASAQYTRSLILFPQDVNSGKFNLELTLGGVTYKAELTLPGGATALAAGNDYTFNITVNKTAINVSQATIVAWNNGGNSNGTAEM